MTNEIKLKQLMPQRFCLKCDICCRFSEKKSVWQPHLLKDERQGPRLKDKDFSPIQNPASKNFICPFFNIKNNRCKIYAHRPFECRLYPFLINRGDKKVFLAVDLNCPHIRKNLKSQKFRDYSRYLSGWLKSPRILGILRDNPQIAHTYEGVLNLTELNLFYEA